MSFLAVHQKLQPRTPVQCQGINSWEHKAHLNFFTICVCSDFENYEMWIRSDNFFGHIWLTGKVIFKLTDRMRSMRTNQDSCRFFLVVLHLSFFRILILLVLELLSKVLGVFLWRIFVTIFCDERILIFSTNFFFFRLFSTNFLSFNCCEL